MPTSSLDTDRLHRLIAAGRSLVSRLDVDEVLDELLEVARELTGARYAALGVLDEERRGLERFLTRGVDPQTHHAIGDLPRGRGILGVLIEDPRPLRLPSVGADARSYGFPPGHPRMESFLGVPVLIRGEAWGNLYLTEKAGGEQFDDADEETAVVLADWAAIAVDNARLYQDSEGRRDALERAVLGLEATTQIARAVGGETDLDRVLELIVTRGRALVRARTVLVDLVEDDEVVLVAGAGRVDRGRFGWRRPYGGGAVERALRTQLPQLVDEVPEDLRAELAPVLAGTAPHDALVVPLVFRGRVLGLLTAYDAEGGAGFPEHHERLLQSFAASAATAVATAQSVAAEQLRASLEAAERERRRWARELHDETLQALGALRVLISSGLRRGSPEALEQVARDAVDQLTTEIASLRTLITELRPAALDDLGLQPALEALAERIRVVEGLEVALHVDTDTHAGRLSGEVETAVYRLVQEALTNVAKHAGATRVEVTVVEHDGQVGVRVRDDGRGFDPAARTAGFGLTGMRERAELAGGALRVESTRGQGTLVSARLRARRAVRRDAVVV